MSKVQITADVELKSNLGMIKVQGKNNLLQINISSASAVIYPLKTYLGLQKYIFLTEKLNQKIVVTIAKEAIIILENGRIKSAKKWWLFKFLFSAMINKGI